MSEDLNHTLNLFGVDVEAVVDREEAHVDFSKIAVMQASLEQSEVVRTLTNFLRDRGFTSVDFYTEDRIEDDQYRIKWVAKR